MPPTRSEFASVLWSGLLGIDPDELTTLERFLVPYRLPDGKVFLEPGATPPGVLFVLKGNLGVSGRLPSGMLSDPLIFGRGWLFGESAFEGVRSVPQRVWGLRGVEGLLLPPNRFAEATAAVPDLPGALRKLGLLRRGLINFSNVIRRDPRFEGLAVPVVLGLLQTAVVHEFVPGQRVLAGPTGAAYGEEVRGLHLLISGALESAIPIPSGRRIERVQPGMLFGGMASSAALTEPAEVTAVEESISATIPLTHIQMAMYASPSLRQRSAAFPQLAQAARDSAVVYGFLGDAGKPMDRIVRLLAQTAMETYHDRVAVLTLVPPGPDRPVGHAVEYEEEGVHTIELAVPLDAAQGEAAMYAALRYTLTTDYLLVDPSRLPPAAFSAVAHVLPRVVYYTNDPFDHPPVNLISGRVSWAVQLGEHRPTSEPAFRPGTVRLRLDLGAVRGATRLSQLSTLDRERLRRWWRALTERRVGLALGGGGAWGYAHTTLIRRMVEVGIPIDIVAGSSFGSLCGAFWCVLHDPSFAALNAFGPDAERATRLAFFTSSVLEHKVNSALTAAVRKATGVDHAPTPRLEDLEIPLLPVATNIGAGSEAIVSLGTVGWGVRCSSSFPGLFAPTTGAGFRYVDGGIVRNVPTDPLASESTDLVIASNIVPNPQFATSRAPTFPGKFGRVLHELNPIGRLDDLIRSSLVLMHAAGDGVAWEADVIFQSAPSDTSPGSLSQGPKIAAGAVESVEEILPMIQSKWRAIRDRAH